MYGVKVNLKYDIQLNIVETFPPPSQSTICVCNTKPNCY